MTAAALLVILKMYFFSVCGAAILWAKSKHYDKRALAFGDVIEKILPNSPGGRYALQFFIFVFFGGMIGMVFANPSTPQQAIAGGVAWANITTSGKPEAKK